MSVTTAQIKKIRTELAKLKPEKVTLDGNRSLTVKEAIFALAPTLERMRKRGFDTQEITGKLHEKGIDVKAPTLAKYLNEFRRKRERKPDRPAPQKREEKPQVNPVKPTEAIIRAAREIHTSGSTVIRSDTPRDGLQDTSRL